MQKVKIPWADNKEDFIVNIDDGEWVITENNELVTQSYVDNSLYEDPPVIKESFLISGLSGYHTTDWLRFFCEEHHPEVDFDKEFETDKSGVFDRYQDKFGYDYTEWADQEIYEELKEALAKKGYCFDWDD